MRVLGTRLDRHSEAFARNRADMLGLLAEIDTAHQQVLAGGGERYVARHRERGKLLPRERIDLLLDEDSPFLELSPLAGWATDDPPGGGIVSGIGLVENTECLILANDPTVRGGAQGPTAVAKALRALEICRENRLPLINLTESGGADLPKQAHIFVPGGAIFRNLSQLSASGIPTITLVFGSSTAGGAYMPGMSDYTVFQRGAARVYLGGPPLVKMAIDEDADEEELGGADMHARTSGLADYLALDEPDAVRIGREIVRHLRWRKLGPAPNPNPQPPREASDELLGIASIDLRVPFDVREILARTLDNSELEEFKPLYGPSLVTGWAEWCGFPVGIVANNGILFSEESHKGAQFIQLCNRSHTPLVFIQNVTGFMVGTRYEQGGIIKDGAKLINAVSNSSVPHVTLMVGASYGAGNYGMSGRAFQPTLCVQLAQPPHRGHGRQTAGRGDVDRPAHRRRAGRPRLRRDSRFDHARRHRSADRARIERAVRDRPPVGRRDRRSPRDAHRGRHGAFGGPLGGRAGFDHVRRLPHVMRRLLIANRGEIARRIARTARVMGIETVAIFADADRSMPFVREADLAVRIGSYLDGAEIVRAAGRAHAEAIHPGYGFLSEHADFAQACLDGGLVWVGPRPAAMRAMASKLEAKRIAADAGVPVLPWALPANAAQVGYPLMIKAAAGGGGRGMRRIDAAADLPRALESAAREAAAAFGDGTLFVERCLDGARHIEVQVLGDQHGNVVHLFERDCSTQRRHQKLIEEAPAPGLSDSTRERLYTAALALARAIDYTNAGTVEFLVLGNDLAFLEMNTRLQVEHPVTEAITSLDLVRLQIEIASGHALQFAQPDITAHGHAIEARLYAEDASNNYLPSIGPLHRWQPDQTPVRWDSGVESGATIGADFDGLLAKAIAHAPTRAEATARLARALRGLHAHGVPTNRDTLVAVLESEAFGALCMATDAALPSPCVPDEIERVHALALEHVLRFRRADARPVLRFVPPGWRNVAPMRTPSGCAYDVTGESAELEVDGMMAHFDVHVADGAAYVNGLGWQTCHALPARFAPSAHATSAAGPSAPLPGTVVSVLVSEGERVSAGQALVVLDAMKIEHQITADVDGQVLEVRVQAGQRVDAHALLVVLGP